MPVIPAMLTTPESRADHLVRHYWENVDFNDTIWLNHQEMLEQAWVDYIDLMRLVPKETINNALRQVYKNAEKQKPFFSYFTTLADKYLVLTQTRPCGMKNFILQCWTPCWRVTY